MITIITIIIIITITTIIITIIIIIILVDFQICISVPLTLLVSGESQKSLSY